MLPPKYPQAAEAVIAGEISTTHAMVVADALDALPAAVSVESRDNAERDLVEYATQMPPAYLEKAAAAMQAGLNPDGVLDTEREHKAPRNARRETPAQHAQGRPRPRPRVRERTHALRRTPRQARTGCRRDTGLAHRVPAQVGRVAAVGAVG
ncbi:MAG: DUF222 domain-containing protein [Streptosporangiales bacterium]|nr:DUF222 domain-containing protein [Streptosporangiales bacterium]